MQSISRFVEYLENHLSTDRFYHSTVVSRTMRDLALLYGVDENRALLAGLLHDIARELPLGEQVRLVKAFKVEAYQYLKKGFIHETYIHGPAGVAQIERIFGLKDSLLLQAVEQHAGNYQGMSHLAKILHLAEVTNPKIDYPGVDRLRRLFKRGDMDEALMIAAVWQQEYLADRGIPVHPAYQANFLVLKKTFNKNSDFACKVKSETPQPA